MKTLATYSIKGGVGKTTTAVNLSFEAASTGARVLLWDLDPQGAATYFFRVKPRVKGGVARLLGRRYAVIGTVFSLLVTQQLGTFATSTILLRTRLAPRWLVVSGYAVAILLLVTVGFLPWVELVFPSWVFALSLYVLIAGLRRGRVGTTAV